MVSEMRGRPGGQATAVRLVAGRLGIEPQVLDSWVVGATSNERPPNESDQIAMLTRMVRDLQRENDILKAASNFFSRELDPRRPR